MNIQLPIPEAQRILADKFAADLKDTLKFDPCDNVSVQIITPAAPAQNKIRGIRALREDYEKRGQYLGLCEAKRMVELVLDSSAGLV